MRLHGKAARTSITLVLSAGFALTVANASSAGSDMRTEDAEPMFGNPKPAIVIINGLVWTGVKGAPQAQALAITGSTITAVGMTEDIRALADKNTMVIDARGRRVIPGITDSHTHIIGAGLQLSRIDLRTATSKEDFVDRVAMYAMKMSPGQWLLGGQFTTESWKTPESPRAAWIDAITPGTPVFLTRTDGHQALVNSVALKYAGIDRSGPPDPPGGIIERNEITGQPTGILKDEAMNLVSKHIPEPSNREKYEALRLACQVANAWGITCVHDMSQPQDLPVFRAARRNNALTVRVCSYVTSEDFKGTLPIIEEYAPGDDLFRVHGFKAFVDGSLGSRTAYMRKPFSDATPETKYPRGIRLKMATDLEQFAGQIRFAHDHKQQLAVHAIGDQAIHDLLDIYASLPGCKQRRHRVEHTQHLLPEDIPRFAELGVIASMQPLHKADDGRWAEKALGARRSQTTYAFRSLLRSGATVCFGSDVPVVTNNPFSGMAAAVSGKTLDGKVWVPSQSIRLEEALRCYTVVPPHAVFQEQKLGTLEVGKKADVVILDRDILAMPIDEIHETEAYVTIVDGYLVWKKPTE